MAATRVRRSRDITPKKDRTWRPAAGSNRLHLCGGSQLISVCGTKCDRGKPAAPTLACEACATGSR